MNKNIIYLTIFISVMIVILLYFSNYKKVELIENRKFSVLGDWESSKLVSEIENKYMLWNTDSERDLEEQPFTDWKIFLVKSIPEILESTAEQRLMIYFPTTFKPKYPMYYQTMNEPTEYFYPRANSMIIITEPLQWVGDTNQVVVIGKKIS